MDYLTFIYTEGHAAHFWHSHSHEVFLPSPWHLTTYRGFFKFYFMFTSDLSHFTGFPFLFIGTSFPFPRCHISDHQILLNFSAEPAGILYRFLAFPNHLFHCLPHVYLLTLLNQISTYWIYVACLFLL